MGVGLIFECFYFLHGSEDDRKMYLEHHTNRTFCDDQTKSKIIKRFGLPFAFTIAFQALMRTRGKCNTPMFYISLLDDYFGLSNQGFQARDTFKTGLSLQTYKHLKEVKNQELLAKTEEAMRNGLVVGGADNSTSNTLRRRWTLERRLWSTSMDALVEYRLYQWSSRCPKSIQCSARLSIQITSGPSGANSKRTALEQLNLVDLRTLQLGVSDFSTKQT